MGASEMAHLHVDLMTPDRDGMRKRTSLEVESVDEAIEVVDAALQEDRVVAAHLLKDDVDDTLGGDGGLVAVYTSGLGWTRLSCDPRGWWWSLGESTRAELMEHAEDEWNAADVAEITRNGEDLTSGSFVQRDGDSHWTLKPTLRAFVSSMRPRTSAEE